MRITISHNRTQADVIKIVDRAMDDVLTGVPGGMVRISNHKKSWDGNTMNFSLTAKAGFLTAPVQGVVIVTDKDVTIDADLGIFDKLIPQEKARAAIEGRVKGLLA